MENVFRYADELGPAKIIQIHEPSCGLKAVLVDNVAASNSWLGCAQKSAKTKSAPTATTASPTSRSRA